MEYICYLHFTAIYIGSDEDCLEIIKRWFGGLADHTDHTGKFVGVGTEAALPCGPGLSPQLSARALASLVPHSWQASVPGAFLAHFASVTGRVVVETRGALP